MASVTEYARLEDYHSYQCEDQENTNPHVGYCYIVSTLRSTRRAASTEAKLEYVCSEYFEVESDDVSLLQILSSIDIDFNLFFEDVMHNFFRELRRSM